MDKSERDEIKNLIDFGNDTEAPAASEALAASEASEISEEAETSAEESPMETENYDGETDIPDIDSDIDDFGDETDIDSDLQDVSDDEDIEDNPIDEQESDTDFEYGFDEPEKTKKPMSKAARIVRNCVIAAAVIAFMVMFIIVDTGIIGAYKRNFKHNFSKIFGISERSAVTETIPEEGEYENTESMPDAVPAEDTEGDGEAVRLGAAAKNAQVANMEVASTAIIPYEYASESDYGAYSGGVVCASTNYMCYINGGGELEWECATSVIDPILETAGGYILIAQKGGTKLCLYEGSKLIYDTDCEDNILAADLSEKGDCVLVTTKDLYKGAIAAYNKSGNLVFARSSGGGSVTDASISPSSRNIAISLLDTDEAVRSTVEIFDITKNNPVSSVAFDDTILFDVEYFKDTVNAFGDNSCIGIKSNGEVIYDLRFDSMDLNHYAYDRSGNKLLLLNASNIPTLMLFNVRGRAKATITALDMADYLCVGNGRIMYNNDREIIMGKPNGKTFKRYTASMDIRDLIMVDKNTFFIVYSNSLELVKV